LRWPNHIVTGEFAQGRRCAAIYRAAGSTLHQTGHNLKGLLAGVTSARERCPISGEDIYERTGEWNESCLVIMSTTYKIVEGTIGLVVILGVIGWGVFRMLKRSYDPAKMLFKLAITVPLVLACFIGAIELSFYGPFVMIILGVAISVIWTPHIGEWLCKPLTGLYDGSDEPPPPKPYYSTAQSLRMKGKFLEAVVEVRKQLARFPTDFEGVMLLAAIQAEDLKDLPGTEITLNHFCDRPDAPPK
jgi:hypothetical protein